MLPVVVLKFGGQTLKNSALIKAAAKRVVALKNQGHSVIVIVSAMGESTNRLLNMAYDVSSEPCKRELDMLVTAGERISMALLSMALHDLECSAISFTGSQAGILTDNSHNGAQIQELKPFRVKEALEQKKVVVLAGFQGVCKETKEVTTLGRGGSDMTAVAFANHFEAKKCEILKEVDGVYSCDPKVFSQSYLLKKIPSHSFSEMTLWGAKVLYHPAAQWVQEQKVPLRIRSALTETEGTQVVHGLGAGEDFRWVCLSSHESMVNRRFFNEVCKKEQAPPLVFLNEDRENLNIDSIKEFFEKNQSVFGNDGGSSGGQPQSSVTLVANSKIEDSEKNKVLSFLDLDSNLDSNSNKITQMFCSSLSLTFFCDPTHRHFLIEKLHHQFLDA